MPAQTQGAPPLRFVSYEESVGTPNIVVDGAPNVSTVLALSHWPGIPQPPSLARDLSTQMAFAYLEEPTPHELAAIVTNNHFDQDGLASLVALTNPEGALAHRDLLIDLAAAGDFATYRHRAAARTSMALATYADPQRSPIGEQLVGRPYPEQSRVLYEQTLPRVLEMLTDPARYRDLWVEEDDNLAASEAALANGSVTIEEHEHLDLAVITISEDLPRRTGHRFGSDHFEEIHPMAINNATDRFRLLFVHGRHHRYVDRYETWVQYRTRRPLPRVDLAALASRLTELEAGSAIWSADAPSVLTPTVAPDIDSSLTTATILEELQRHLRAAPPAWDPYAPAP